MFDTNLYPGSGSILLLDSTRFYGKTINKKNFLVVEYPKKGKKLKKRNNFKNKWVFIVYNIW